MKGIVFGISVQTFGMSQHEIERQIKIANDDLRETI